MSAIDKDPFPKPALYAAGALIAMSILFAAGARYMVIPEPSMSASVAPLATLDLSFADTENGSVLVTDVTTGDVVYVAAPGTNGFMRGVMRSFARDRRARGIGEGPAFRLSEWPDGRLSLDDLATGRSVELGAFGGDNRAAFAQLLAWRRQS